MMMLDVNINSFQVSYPLRKKKNSFNFTSHQHYKFVELLIVTDALMNTKDWPRQQNIC